MFLPSKLHPYFSAHSSTFHLSLLSPSSTLYPFALFPFPITDLSSSTPYPDIRLLTVYAILVVYPFLAFLASFVSASLACPYCCFVVLSFMLALVDNLSHLETVSRWGSNFFVFLLFLLLNLPQWLAHFLCYPFVLLQFPEPFSCPFFRLCYAS